MSGRLPELRRRIEGALDPLIPAGATCALVDYPNYGNVGDSAIWLGEIAYLRRRGCRIVHACSDGTYDRRTLLDAVGSGTILLNGGGNFGDLWPDHQELRERLVQDFPGNRVIQLPQSIHFDSPRALARAQQVFRTHADFHILVRDPRSEYLARQTFSNPVHLCPDMALMLDLGRLSPSADAANILVLSRTDKEKAVRFGIDALPSEDLIAADWIEEPTPADRWLFDWANRRLTWRSKVPRRMLHRLTVVAATRMARQRLARGVGLLRQGRVLVTDRLHALILGWLGGMPVYFVDNSYGKLAGFRQCWLELEPSITQARSFSEAIAGAREALERKMQSPGNGYGHAARS
jgi:pyruvyl transferase EpsO